MCSWHSKSRWKLRVQVVQHVGLIGPHVPQTVQIWPKLGVGSISAFLIVDILTVRVIVMAQCQDSAQKHAVRVTVGARQCEGQRYCKIAARTQ